MNQFLLVILSIRVVIPSKVTIYFENITKLADLIIYGIFGQNADVILQV
jgi:hypothetical protein